MIPCSVAILTFNNEATVSRALESVKDFDDIIVCDGGSTDRTLKIANSYGAMIISQDGAYKFPNNKIRDYSGVRNQTLNAAKYKWFFFLDSDEYLTQEIVAEVKSVVSDKQTPPAAYWVPRKYVLNGEVIRCATTYPNRQMRFFHRGATERFIKEVHERIKVKDGATVLMLKEHMLVPMCDSIAEVRKKWRYYADLEATRPNVINLWLVCKVIYGNVKISTLFILRYIRNVFFCRGPRVPFVHEMERHVYHIQIISAFLKRMISERTTFQRRISKTK